MSVVPLFLEIRPDACSSYMGDACGYFEGNSEDRRRAANGTCLVWRASHILHAPSSISEHNHSLGVT